MEKKNSLEVEKEDMCGCIMRAKDRVELVGTLVLILEILKSDLQKAKQLQEKQK